jgi:hypothetical protein
MLQSWKVGCVLGLASVCLMAQPPAPPPHGGWGGAGRFAFMPFGMGPETTVTGAPYSAVQTMEMTQKLGDGNVISEKQQSSVYRDTQGRLRIEHTLPARPGSNSQGARTVISIFDPVAGANYMLQPATNTAYKSTMHQRPASDATTSNQPQRPQRRGSSSSNPPVTENLGLQTINGVAANGTRTTTTIPAGAIGNAQPIQTVREVWIAQDLKVPVMIKNSDPRFGETVMQLTNIQQGNPDPSLFQVPANYTVQNGPARPSGMGRIREPSGDRNRQ